MSEAILRHGSDGGYHKAGELVGRFAKPTLYRRISALRLAGWMRTRGGKFITTDAGKAKLPPVDAPEKKENPEERPSRGVITLDCDALIERWRVRHGLR